MPKQWVKEELRKNEVARVTEKAAGWAVAHRELALGIGGSALAAVFLGLYGYSRYRDMRNTAWERLAFAENYALAGQTKAADEQLKAVSDQYPSSKAAGFGQLFDGDVLFQTGDYQGAIAAYQKVLGRQDPTLTPFANAGIAISQEAAGQCQAATETAQRFLSDSQDHYLAPQVHSILARCLKTLGREEEAKSALEKISLLYPDTSWAQWAQSILQPAAAAAPVPAKAAPTANRPAAPSPAQAKAAPAAPAAAAKAAPTAPTASPNH